MCAETRRGSLKILAIAFSDSLTRLSLARLPPPEPSAIKPHQRPFLSQRGAFSVRLIGGHKKVPYLSVGISMTMILPKSITTGGSDECRGPQGGS